MDDTEQQCVPLSGAENLGDEAVKVGTIAIKISIDRISAVFKLLEIGRL